jgi:hypothetical protein
MFRSVEGRVLVEDFPKDHFHHYGLCRMWPLVWINGKQYDLCHIYGIRNEQEGLHQVFDQWTIREAGFVCRILVAKNHWVLDDGQPVMDEEALLRILINGTGPDN